jgi:flagella basal body P-ring formation protein FlgA
MMRLVLAVILSATPVAADTVVATRTIRSMAIIEPGDLQVVEGTTPGAAEAVDDLVGMEARTILYPGRPIRLNQVGPPALVERNSIVTLLFSTGGLSIATEGRALGRAGVGDSLRVMNLTSKKTVLGRVRADGTVEVGQE